MPASAVISVDTFHTQLLADVSAVYARTPDISTDASLNPCTPTIANAHVSTPSYASYFPLILLFVLSLVFVIVVVVVVVVAVVVAVLVLLPYHCCLDHHYCTVSILKSPCN